MKYVYILGFIIVFVLTSCKNNSLKKDLTGFVGQEITLPDKLPAMVGGKDSLISNFMESPLKLVVFYDSVGCSSCRVSHLYEWDEIIVYSIAMKEKFTTVFIFTPSQSSLNELKMSLRSTSTNYPMFIDKDGEFLKLNPAVPKDSRLHTFLIDRDNKVVMAGNPVSNPAIWNLYKEQIKELAGK